MIDPGRLLSLKIPERLVCYDRRDSILYALGIGLGADPLDGDQLRYVYEKDLQAFPTQAVVIGADPIEQYDTGITFELLVHGEQSLVLYGALPAEGRVICRSRFASVYDNGPGRGAFVELVRELFNPATDAKIATSCIGLFSRGDGGFGGQRRAVVPMAERPALPEVSVEVPTLSQQALLYRLSGDYNPLHADPETALRAGFERPILHGLATYGILGRVIVETFLGWRHERLRSLHTRFSAPVFPGETIRFDFWREGTNVCGEASVPERGVTVLKNIRASFSP